MAELVSTLKDIRFSPHNDSVSNQTWKIPTDTRFKPHKIPLCKEAFYTLPCQKMTRKAHIGIGTKSDFMKDTEGFPPPNKYDLSDFVRRNRAKKKGYIFGLSRKKVKVNSWQIASSGFPGVGTYDHKSQLKQMPNYSMAKKYKNPYSYSTAKQMPKIGPGKYEFTPAINKKGVYQNTKYGNSRSKLWNPPRSIRFSTVLSEGRIVSVGPGKYGHKAASMPKDGVYSCSKFRNSKSRRFGKEKRNPLGLKTKKEDITPGPGAYRYRSDFGWYETKPKKRKRRRRRAKTKPKTAKK